MKGLLSMLAVALALAVTGPAFAGDITKATTKADCDKAGGTWDDRKRCVLRRRCNGLGASQSPRRGVGFGRRPFSPSAEHPASVGPIIDANCLASLAGGSWLSAT